MIAILEVPFYPIFGPIGAIMPPHGRIYKRLSLTLGADGICRTGAEKWMRLQCTESEGEP